MHFNTFRANGDSTCFTDDIAYEHQWNKTTKEDKIESLIAHQSPFKLKVQEAFCLLLT